MQQAVGIMSTILKEVVLKGGAAFQLVQGDITRERTDAIVNAANAQLQHGAGVAGAIVRQGGHQIQIESDKWVNEHGPVTHEAPAYTTAGDLPCRWVIHAVGPVWGSGDEEGKLSAAVRGSLELAGKLNLNSLALPAISTGIFGFPKELAARVILDTIHDYFLSKPSSNIAMVRLVIFDAETQKAFMQAWDKFIPTSIETQ